ncbi:MAG: HNH endonuclease [Shewanella xiamenensis]|uniref:HNH endonuclease n=1 Tax=Shewanella xiamenensis TaxID=332186 RepID=UPI0024328D45|nr:HNH endonuclease [Shewanella xiamenensis]
MSIPEKTVASVLVKCARHCSICRRFSPLQIQVHHIIEQCDGGTHDEDNLLPVCIGCHSTIHTKTHMTKNFSSNELKGHRDEVYDMVAKGKLPAQAQVTSGEMHALSATILATLKAQNEDTKLSETAAELLLAAACEEDKLKVQKFEHSFHITVGGQNFSLKADEKEQFPKEILELLNKGYVTVGGDYAEISDSGISHVQELVKTTAKFIEKKVKCLKCSLHFTIHSWNPDSHRAKDLHCPECGQSEGVFVVWAQQRFGFIFQQVPGNASPWDIGDLSKQSQPDA